MSGSLLSGSSWSLGEPCASAALRATHAVSLPMISRFLNTAKASVRPEPYTVRTLMAPTSVSDVSLVDTKAAARRTTARMDGSIRFTTTKVGEAALRSSTPTAVGPRHSAYASSGSPVSDAARATVRRRPSMARYVRDRTTSSKPGVAMRPCANGCAAAHARHASGSGLEAPHASPRGTASLGISVRASGRPLISVSNRAFQSPLAPGPSPQVHAVSASEARSATVAPRRSSMEALYPEPAARSRPPPIDVAEATMSWYQEESADTWTTGRAPRREAV
jgi:hypothetical protein